MHVNVRDILVETVGYSRTFKISGERPALDGLQLSDDIEGEFTLSRLEFGLLLTGQVTTAVELECDRCLRSFSRPVKASLRQVFAEAPGDDEMPIDRAGEIDLASLISQEIILGLPVKVLCQPDCPGITPTPTIHQPKGTNSGRTQKTHHP